MICFISSSNPISSMRSASSMTRAFKFLKTKPFVFCSGVNKEHTKSPAFTHLKVIQ